MPMIEQIKERIKAWKRLYTRNCKSVDENSSWREILTELEYYNFRKFRNACEPKMREALKTIGTFSKEELEFLDTLPAYTVVMRYLKYHGYYGEFTEKIDDLDVYSMCLAETEDIPLGIYTIVTDRSDLWGLEIYVFKYSRFPVFRRHGIIRYDKDPPADFVVPKCEKANLSF